jgi:hypothetical protein
VDDRALDREIADFGAPTMPRRPTASEIEDGIAFGLLAALSAACGAGSVVNARKAAAEEARVRSARPVDLTRWTPGSPGLDAPLIADGDWVAVRGAAAVPPGVQPLVAVTGDAGGCGGRGGIAMGVPAPCSRAPR